MKKFLTEARGEYDLDMAPTCYILIIRRSSVIFHNLMGVQLVFINQLKSKLWVFHIILMF
jgi:hypothetical protein